MSELCTRHFECLLLSALKEKKKNKDMVFFSLPEMSNVMSVDKLQLMAGQVCRRHSVSIFMFHMLRWLIQGILRTIKKIARGTPETFKTDTV